ncbi:hypothetical protein HDK90DRAFT_556201 [Phyllosticta capitalensis]|uniref:Uncharacterized protein n=1 Tax=Phyllosticta capitalensis TaxID=121624 RepID=A0ABR1YI06_9PEZI
MESETLDAGVSSSRWRNNGSERTHVLVSREKGKTINERRKSSSHADKTRCEYDSIADARRRTQNVTSWLSEALCFLLDSDVRSGGKHRKKPRCQRSLVRRKFLCFLRETPAETRRDGHADSKAGRPERPDQADRRSKQRARGQTMDPENAVVLLGRRRIVRHSGGLQTPGGEDARGRRRRDEFWRLKLDRHGGANIGESFGLSQKRRQGNVVLSVCFYDGWQWSMTKSQSPRMCDGDDASWRRLYWRHESAAGGWLGGVRDGSGCRNLLEEED